jgi:hypothetical protein
MAKAPRLGNLHRYFPKWWHKAEPRTVGLENFQPKPDPSMVQQDESRFEKLAEIALHGSPPHSPPPRNAPLHNKDSKKAA